MKLVTVLKDYRRNKSTELGVPPYRIYSNNVLNEIASTRPCTQEMLLSIKGFGKKTYENYGEDILRICLDQSLTFDESDKLIVSTNVSVKSRVFEPIKKELTQNPRDLKRQLARLVVDIYQVVDLWDGVALEKVYQNLQTFMQESLLAPRFMI